MENFKENFKEIFKKYLWLVILVSLFAVGSVVFWIGGVLEENKTAQSVQTSQSNSQAAVLEAQTNTQQAANVSVERRTEDGVRARVIIPKLEDSRRRSQQSKIDIKIAEEKYSDENITHENISNSRSRNCEQLARFYPNRQFEYCSGVAVADSGSGSNANGNN
jgi:preprotein translocase subunit SecF